MAHYWHNLHPDTRFVILLLNPFENYLESKWQSFGILLGFQLFQKVLCVITHFKMNADQRMTYKALKNVLIGLIFPASVLCLDS